MSTRICDTAGVSDATTLADYRAALTAPGAGRPVLASLLARLPVAMGSIAILVYVQRTTGTFASAGLVSAGALVGVAVGSVAQGRLIDRLGPTRPLLAVSVAFAAVVTLAVLAVEARAPLAVLVGLALLAGATQPAVSAASRALWARLVPAGPQRQAAYSYEAISMETFFVLGPGLAGLLAAAPWAGTGVVVAAGCMLLGAVSFALTGTVRAWRPEPRTRPGSALDGALDRALGGLAGPGMRTLVIAALGFGAVIGVVEVAVPASATLAGYPAVGGLLLGTWSVSSVICGIGYSARPWPRPLHLRVPVLLAGFAAGVSVLAIPTTLLGLGLAMLVAGALITPQAIAHSAVIEQVAPAGAVAEAFGWVITAVTLGLAAGQSVSGQLVETVGPRAAFLAGTAGGLALAGILWLRRRTLLPAPVDGRAPGGPPVCTTFP